jgi:hypothetical protein
VKVLLLALFLTGFYTVFGQCTGSFKIKLGSQWFADGTKVSVKDLQKPPTSLQCTADLQPTDIAGYQWNVSYKHKSEGFWGYGFEQFKPIVNKLDSSAIILLYDFRGDNDSTKIAEPKKFVLFVK